YHNEPLSMQYWALYLSAITAALIALAAYLGGRLVYEHAVGVDVEG
nr:DUF2231 domain-containing protein [Pseudomonas sp.]